VVLLIPGCVLSTYMLVLVLCQWQSEIATSNVSHYIWKLFTFVCVSTGAFYQLWRNAR